MDQTSISPEIMEHARGALTFELEESMVPMSGITAYQCKLYKARLDQASASENFIRKSDPSSWAATRMKFYSQE